jgi:hypothetical protein
LSVGTFGYVVVGFLEESSAGMSLNELYGRLAKDLDPGMYPSTRRKMEHILWDQKLYGNVERVPGKLRFWRATEAGRRAVQAAGDRFENAA